MNNTRLQEALIDNFKREFKEKLDKGVKVTICNKWQSEANFTDKANMWAIIKLVFDYTGWTWKETYEAGIYKRKKGGYHVGLRNEDRFFQRSVIDYLLVNNGVSLVACAKETNRNCHSTVINAITKFEHRLESEYYVQKMFAEIAQYVKENYSMYKDRTTLKIGVVSDSL